MSVTNPNIVLIVMDTARADEATLTKDTLPMEFLSGVTTSGTVFTNARANAPWTLPSHGTLFSGQYPSVHGAHAGHKSFEYTPTLPAILSEAGYSTVGISNNTWISSEFGFDRGFDEFLATWQLFQDSVDFGDIAQTRTNTVDRLRGILEKFSGNPMKNLVNLIYGNFFRKRYDDGAQRTNNLLAKNLHSYLDDGPLFLFLNYLEPHLEYRPPEEVAREWLPDDVSYAESQRVNQDAWGYITGAEQMSERDFTILRALYRAELAYLDERIAELYGLFDQAGIVNETVFIVTGDHGENIGEHGLMDHQYSLHETLLRVPLVMFGGPAPKKGRVDTPVQLTDIPPTILEFAGIDVPDEWPGYILGSPNPIESERSIYSEYLAPQPAIETLQERYRCCSNVEEYDRRLRSVYRDGWKFIRGSDDKEWLFDVSSDPEECENLVSSEPMRRDELCALLEQWTDGLPSVEHDDVSMDTTTRERLEDLGYLQ